MLLAIDTSTTQMGLALINGGGVIVETIWNSPAYHTVELAPAVAGLLERAHATVTELEAVAVAIGPGSYTALRVGLGFAKGLAMARKIPILGVPTLDILAAGQPSTTLLLVAILRAGRGRLAVGWYRSSKPAANRQSTPIQESESGWVPKGTLRLLTVDELARSITKPSLVAGELTEEERHRLARRRVKVVLAPLSRCVRRPSVLAEIAWRRLGSGQVDDLTRLAPVYLQTAAAVPA
ncbi:MAG TPA: tRNA (adenosine(37)-N6)-threonylcarbamoyltransferase complex dimerization subunit type 1 TsaB [Anaerolineales bacterium]|nr:tRNA (adenosine(37)-N6)-threonylcarbamoyltransferase complex dimerization subunit type 1 TsaB [Anaerolineales bacterium]